MRTPLPALIPPAARVVAVPLASAAIAIAVLASGAGSGRADDRVADVAGTRHNLSVSGPGEVRASGESQLCVFCHTPHAAEAGATPLWNRALSGATYTPYTSTSLDAELLQGILAQPAGSSKLCLSCHDGTLAIGSVNVLDGEAGANIDMLGTDAGAIPAGDGLQSGFTRNLGADLGNDHPISFTYDGALARADGELRDPAGSAHIGVRDIGVKPLVPLEPTGPGGDGQVQCATCHDPHLRAADPQENAKFLRLHRLQRAAPGGGAFSPANDLICLACHDKGLSWAISAHADPAVADELYRADAAAQREFPDGTAVWQAGCLNCHDPHTVHGARRLAREGSDSPLSPKSGGESAIEETCYQCHSAAGTLGGSAVLQGQGLAGFAVPDIRTDFLLPRHMPITSFDQPAGEERHDIADADLGESRQQLGRGDLQNRHAECSDCHNPHRVLRNRLFNAAGDDAFGTHAHGPSAISPGHSNIASGVLRGAWGVEPAYGSASFLSLPTQYIEKRGDPPLGAGSAVGNSYLTREYQLCLKCHSDYGYNDDNAYPESALRPELGASGGGTPFGTNDLRQYTNQAMEFQAPLAHRGEVTTLDSGAGAAYTSNNHRGWHPVIGPTGRSAAVRNMSAGGNLFLDPWNGANIGSQTMYCSDCHGSDTPPGSAEPVGGDSGRPWGPHGSENDFILKGGWDQTSGADDSAVCFRCHSYSNYATEENEGDREGFESGFGGPKDSNLHAFHAKRIDRPLQCMWCHTAVPHGWKNKALLVNLNDVGIEGGGPAGGAEVPISSDADSYTRGPYYVNAKLKIRTFASSGNWEESNCGSASGSPDVGREWMKQVCANPP